MPRNSIKIEIGDTKQTDALLAKLPIEMRETSLVQGLRAAGSKVLKSARRKLPRPGYPGDKDPDNQLAKSLATVIRRYPNAIAAFVGPRGDMKSKHQGRHGHLVEFGHDVKRSKDGPVLGFAPPRPFLRPAADETKAEQERALVERLKQDIEKVQA